jgi:hypothetical protein
MTTTRIDHTGHGHPATTAARTACRKIRGGVDLGWRVAIHAPASTDWMWGTVTGFTAAGEIVLEMFTITGTLYITATDIVAAERAMA